MDMPAIPAPSPCLRARAAKRLFDIAAASIGLALCLPLFALIALAVTCDDGGPVLFRQTRVGRGGRTFRILKFRTMRVALRDAGPSFTPDGDARVTRAGRRLRAAKLDELPQLLNVLKGDMSLVGPRPETPELIAHYTPAQRALLLSARPGITDYASILLRNEGALLARAADPAAFYRDVLMPIKYQLCRLYLEEMGLRADLKILMMTARALALREPPLAPFAVAETAPATEARAQ